MKLNHNYFPRIIIEWNKLDPSIYDSSSYPLFKKMVVFLRFKAQSVRLQDGLSQLPEHKLSQKQFTFIESNLCYWQRYQNYYIIPSPM